jgi:hypothetical protein
MSMADATASAWYAKLKYMWWRPITAIREADTDGDPQTPACRADTASHHAAVSRLAERPVLVRRRRDGGAVPPQPDGTVDLILISPGAGPRHYVDAATMQVDAVNARVWSGLHFRTADQASITIGTRVANFALDHYFAPMR